MATSIIPQVGVSGIFELAEPFENALQPGVEYSCEAVRKLSDVVAAGGDPREEYYTPYGLDELIYARDVENGECIVTLQASIADIVHVPTSFIKSYPSMGGIPYSVVALGVLLSALPESLDLTPLRNALADRTHEVLGVTPEIKTMVMSSTLLKSLADHQSIEAARQAIIAANPTDRQLYLQEKARADALQAQVNELEAYILAHQ